MTSNQGFVTEQAHYDHLSSVFEFVTPPKNSGGGSDFLVVHKGIQASFESKTSNTDIFDAGVLGTFSNGQIYDSSAFLLNPHVNQLQNLIKDNLDKVQDYLNEVGATTFPHTIPVEDYERAKAQKKLIHLMTDKPLPGIIEASFLQTYNRFVKANYIVIGEAVYCISHAPELDPLKLLDKGAAILDDSCINKVSIRSARSGTRKGRSTVALRTQFRLHKQLPLTRVTLKDLAPPV